MNSLLKDVKVSNCMVSLHTSEYIIKECSPYSKFSFIVLYDNIFCIKMVKGLMINISWFLAKYGELTFYPKSELINFKIYSFNEGVLKL